MKSLKPYKSNCLSVDNDILMMATYISKRMKSSKQYKRSMNKTNKSKQSKVKQNSNKSNSINNSSIATNTDKNNIKISQNQKQKQNLHLCYISTLKNMYYNNLTINKSKKQQDSMKYVIQLPQYAKYFLGSVLHKIKNNHNFINYNQFAQQTERIFAKSAYQDIKYFIQLMDMNNGKVEEKENDTKIQKYKSQFKNKEEQRCPLKQKQCVQNALQKIQITKKIQQKTIPNAEKNTIILSREQNIQEKKEKFFSNIPMTASFQSKIVHQTPISKFKLGGHHFQSIQKSQQVSRAIQKCVINNQNAIEKIIPIQKQIIKLNDKKQISLDKCLQSINNTLSDFTKNKNNHYNNYLTNNLNSYKINLAGKQNANFAKSQQKQNNKMVPIMQKSIKQQNESLKNCHIQLNERRSKSKQFRKQDTRIDDLTCRLQKILKNNEMKIANSKNVRNLI